MDEVIRGHGVRFGKMDWVSWQSYALNAVQHVLTADDRLPVSLLLEHTEKELSLRGRHGTGHGVGHFLNVHEGTTDAQFLAIFIANRIWVLSARPTRHRRADRCALQVLFDSPPSLNLTNSVQQHRLESRHDRVQWYCPSLPAPCSRWLPTDHRRLRRAGLLRRRAVRHPDRERRRLPRCAHAK